MRLVFSLGTLACLGGAVYAFYLIASRLFIPWVERVNSDAMTERKLNQELRMIVHRQQLTTSQQAWDDLQVHRERLERSLDDMHNNTGDSR